MTARTARSRTRLARTVPVLAFLSAVGVVLVTEAVQAAGPVQLAQANAANRNATPAGRQQPITRSEMKKLCNKFMRDFDAAVETVPQTPNVQRARILRRMGSNYCREGRHGKGHLYLQGALMGIGITPEPNNVIQKAIRERDERTKAIEERYQ